MVAYRLSGENADRTRSCPELREWTPTSRPSRDVKGRKEEASTNVSVLSGQPLVTVPPLYRLSIRSRLSSYTARRIEQFIPSSPFLRLNSPQASAREGVDENGQEAQGQQPGHAPYYLCYVTNYINYTEAFPKLDRRVR
jgi:hypothetical protein